MKEVIESIIDNAKDWRTLIKKLNSLLYNEYDVVMNENNEVEVYLNNKLLLMFKLKNGDLEQELYTQLISRLTKYVYFRRGKIINIKLDYFNKDIKKRVSKLLNNYLYEVMKNES